MDFITIDFETATTDRHSPCEIGLTFVKDNNVVETKSWLIKPLQYPDFFPFNIEIHGIHPQDVADKPDFAQLWNMEVRDLVQNQFLISHNAGFDMSVLRRTLEAYSLPSPTINYSCSYIISKHVWKGLLSYDLKSLCHYNNIPINHHRAGPDSLACANLSLKAFESAGVTSIDDFPEKLTTTVGQLYVGGYNPSLTKRIFHSKNPGTIVGNPAKHNSESIFYGKTIVFTGALTSMIRANAQQLIADIGGVNSNTITKETDFLIVGQQDFRFVGEDGMSNKQEKAHKLLEKGTPIEVISESDFLRNI